MAGERKMQFIIALIIGGVVGCVGSILGKFVVGNFLGMGGMGLRDGIDIPSLIVAFIGAVVLLGAVNFFRRGSVR